MALTPDQKAVLELLLAGQTYSELEELLGLPVDDVRSRARAGLTELGGADPDRRVGLSDYLLGQADPIGRADAVRHLRQDAADHELAVRISDRLAEIAPAADLPKLPPAPGGGSFLSRGAPAEPAAPSSESRSRLSALPRGRSRVYAGLGAAAVVLIAVVLAVTGVFAGDDEPADAGETTPSAEGETGTDGTSEGETSGIPDGQEVATIPLRPTGNGDARGAATIGLSTGDQPYIDLAVENLEQAPSQQAYVVWFMFDEDTGYPLSPIFPQQGSFNDRFAIPPAVVSLIFNQRLGAESIEVALSDAQETLTEIQQAAQDETYRIERPGRTVLEGRIPDVPAAGNQGSDQGS